MLKQSWSVARVILSLPAVFKRTGEAYELPEWLLKKNASLRFSVCAKFQFMLQRLEESAAFCRRHPLIFSS